MVRRPYLIHGGFGPEGGRSHPTSALGTGAVDQAIYLQTILGIAKFSGPRRNRLIHPLMPGSCNPSV